MCDSSPSIVDVVAISDTEVKLFIGGENTGFRMIDLQTATAEEIKVDLDKAGKPIKVLGSVQLPSSISSNNNHIHNSNDLTAPDRGIVICHQSKKQKRKLKR